MSWALVKITGKTLTNPDGTVRSLNPASQTAPYGPYHWESRPAGTAGPFELCEVQGDLVVYNPMGGFQPPGEAVVYAFAPKVPNCDGFSALHEEPIE